jgi:hypothetical protein
VKDAGTDTAREVPAIPDTRLFVAEKNPQRDPEHQRRSNPDVTCNTYDKLHREATRFPPRVADI